MKTAKLALVFALIGVGALSAANAVPETSAGAQQSQLPSGPLLKKIPDFSAWRISFSYAQDGAKSPAVENKEVDYGPGPDPDYIPARIRRITLIRTKPMWLAITEDVKGNKVEQCWDGFDEYVKSSRFEDVHMITRGDPTMPVLLMDFANIDFPDMDWISPETFKGVQVSGDQSCMVFSKDGATAWIDLNTRLPLAWKRAGETRVFERLPQPTKMVDLPPKVDKFAEAVKKDRERLVRRVPRG